MLSFYNLLGALKKSELGFVEFLKYFHPVVCFTGFHSLIWFASKVEMLSAIIKFY